MQNKAIQKKSDLEEEELIQGKTIQKKSSNNTNLPDNVMNKMKSSFNTDFSNANIHKNSQYCINVIY